MGKKDKKKKNPSVQEKKKQKQQEKAKKKAAKGDGGEKELAEEDIEAILAEFRAKEATKTAVSINLCPQPSPRANFSLTTLPSGEMLLFGGEYYDGEVSTCYNGVYRWHIEKQEWRVVESINTPPPRCSHQAVCFRDHLYVFGGEFSTSDQFYHYRDFWRLDLKTNQWEELPQQKDTPSARSGHRMVVYRNFLLLFGGFYEAFRETRWYNDLYVYSFADLKWRKIDFPTHALAPSPRSGHQMVVSSVGDVAVVYGGYSRVKPTPTTTGGKGGSSSKGSEGKVHDDVWVLQLKHLPQGGQPFWERASRKGTPPSSRCGASMVGYRNIALLFGGVHDIEGKQHALSSEFFADLYQLDLTRRKWFHVTLRSAAKDGGQRRRRQTSAQKGGADPSADSDEEGEKEEGEKEEEREEDREGAFAFIDQDGNVVYMMDEEEDEEEGEKEGGKGEEGGKGKEETPGALSPPDALPAEEGGREIPQDTKPSIQEGVGKEGSGKVVQAAAAAPVVSRAVVRVLEGGGLVLMDPEGRVGPIPRINAALTMRGHLLFVYGGLFEDGDREVTCDDAWCLDLNKRASWTCLLPGTMHQQVWRGEDETEGEDSDDDDSDDDSDSEDENSDSSDSEEEEDEEEEGAAAAAAEEEEERKKREKKEKKKDKGERKEKKRDKKEKRRGKEEEGSSEEEEEEGGGGGRDASGRRVKHGGNSIKAEIEELQSRLAVDDASTTPQMGEKLRDFFARTTEYWTHQAVAEVERRQAEQKEKAEKAEKEGEEGAGGGGEMGGVLQYADEAGMREKEYRRLAFSLATQRFEEVRPVLDRLDELETEQREAEERLQQQALRKGGGGGRAGSGRKTRR